MHEVQLRPHFLDHTSPSVEFIEQSLSLGLLLLKAMTMMGWWRTCGGVFICKKGVLFLWQNELLNCFVLPAKLLMVITWVKDGTAPLIFKIDWLLTWNDSTSWSNGGLLHSAQEIQDSWWATIPLTYLRRLVHWLSAAPFDSTRTPWQIQLNLDRVLFTCLSTWHHLGPQRHITTVVTRSQVNCVRFGLIIIYLIL